MGVVPVLVGGHRQVDPDPAAIGLVDHIDEDLVAHDLALIVQLVLVEIGKGHPVGLGPQHSLQGVGRHDLVIVGEVVAGGSVVHAAGSVDQIVECAVRQIARALEHQVFEQVGKAGAAARLVAEADAVIDAHRCGRNGVVLRQHDTQPVIELVIADIDREIGRDAARGAGAGFGGGRCIACFRRRVRRLTGCENEGADTGCQASLDVHDVPTRCNWSERISDAAGAFRSNRHGEELILAAAQISAPSASVATSSRPLVRLALNRARQRAPSSTSSLRTWLNRWAV